MQKPNSYDEVKTEWIPPMVGGHYCTIKKVEESKTKTGKDMIVVYFDFNQQDKQPDYFMNEFKSDIRPEKKWPFVGTSYIMVNDYKDETKTSRNFKRFCESVEKSNPGYEVQWGDNWGAQFEGKSIGAVFGKVENEYNGKTTMRSQLRWFCSSDAVATAKVPDEKYLPNTGKAASTDNTFVDVPAGVAEEVPF